MGFRDPTVVDQGAGGPSWMRGERQPTILRRAPPSAMTTTPTTAAIRRRNQRVCRYRQLVRPLAFHYARRCKEPLDDLIQVGLMGLMRAAELYSRESGTPFEAFARPHVRGAILHYLRDTAPALRLPRQLGERRQQLQRVRQDWLRNHGCEPRPQDLRKTLGLSADQWQKLGEAMQLATLMPLDLERIAEGQAGLIWSDPAGDDQQGRSATQALRQLEPPLRDVVRRVVLEGRSYRNVAALLQISPMTVQRRLHRALAILRQELSPAEGPWRRPAPAAAAAC